MITAYLVVLGGPAGGEGYLEVFLLRIMLFYTPTFLAIYSPIRFILFHILTIKKNYLIGVPLGYVDLIFKKIIVVLIILILLSGTIFSFDQITKGRYLKLKLDQPIAYRVDPETFRLDKSEPIKIDTASFEVINNIYARDNNYVYTGNIMNGSFQNINIRILEEADPKTFEILLKIPNSPDVFARDKNLLFYRSGPLPWVVDPQSFEMIRTNEGKQSNFYRDNINVYYEVIGYFKYYPIDGADPKSFVIEGYTAHDKYRTYDSRVLRENFLANKGNPLISPNKGEYGIPPVLSNCTCDEGVKNGFYGFISEPLTEGTTEYNIKYISDVTISFKSEDGKTKIEIITNAQGRHDIDNLPCGRYVLTVTHPNYEARGIKPGFSDYTSCTYRITNIFMIKK